MDGIADTLESTTADRDGDGFADASDYDPQGYLYCEDDGRILAGGSISITGPAGSNSSVGTANNIRIVKDGSDGEYQWFVNAPGTYTMAVSYPTSVGIPSTMRTSSGLLDLTTLLPANPASMARASLVAPASCQTSGRVDQIPVLLRTQQQHSTPLSSLKKVTQT